MSSPIVPAVTDESRPYWDGLRQRVLLVQRCGTCGELRHPPQPMCRRCGSWEAAWIAVSGRATLLSFTEVRHAVHPSVELDVPYFIALVKLEEGVVVVSRLVGVSPMVTKVGMSLRPVFHQVASETVLVHFAPA